MKLINNYPDNIISPNKDKKFVLNHIVNEIEKGEGKSIQELKEEYSEEHLLYTAYQYVTTTKKVVCMALDIPVEGACRWKRKYEKVGQLVQSTQKFICPFTGHYAHLLTTDPNEFGNMSYTNQLTLNFD